MITSFKQVLFVSQRKVSPLVVADISNPAIRAQLQAHVDSLGTLPSADAPDEYAALFEAAYPVEKDRRAFIDAKITGAKPSYGHLALATLMHAGLARIVWTTNFDPLVADACAKIYDATGPLTTIDLDAPDQASTVIGEERWPVEIKLHGDFRSRRLKNTSDELRHQDAHLRQIFVDLCGRFGLVVAGYSGRDDSVLSAFEEALHKEGTFPSGLFWLHRGEEQPLPRVAALLSRVKDAGVEGGLVRIENFDEILRDLVRLVKNIDTAVLDSFGGERKRLSFPPPPAGRHGWPIVRLNALPVVQMPSVCRRVDCQIGGSLEVRQAVAAANVDLLVARTRVGVLAFGADSDVRTALEPFKITNFDLHPIDVGKLRYESGERGLLREALSRAIGRHRGLQVYRRHTVDQMAPLNINDAAWSALRSLVGPLQGMLKGASLRWREGISVRLDWAGDQLWLLVEPITVFEGITPENKAVAADFGRERTVKRYNRKLNDLFSFWARVVAGDGDDLRALGISDGVDAVFRLSRDTAYSRRIGA